MGSLLELFIKDERLTERVKFEDYLSVYFDVRPASFFTLPAELPNAAEFGKRIDDECVEDTRLIMATKDLQLRGELILRLRHKIDKLFKSVVLKSDIYEAHKSWAKQLGLRIQTDKVRPSIQEVYLFKEKQIGKRLKNLFKVRREIRKAIYKMRPLNLPPSLLVYPEELSTAYVKEIGSILGYPECCVKRYATERASDVYVEERVSKQIKDLKSSGGVPDLFAFFSSSFIPHDPKCVEASKLGRRLYDILKEKLPGSEARYETLLRENMNVAENFPELLENYRRRADEKVKDFIMHM